MKRLVKVYISIPSEFYDRENIEDFFEGALRSHGGQYESYHPHRILRSCMEIERIQVGPKKKGI